MEPTERLEIKITPEMIEAGLGPLLRFSRERDLYEEAVSEIYRAMEMARLKAKPLAPAAAGYS